MKNGTIGSWWLACAVPAAIQDDTEPASEIPSCSIWPSRSSR